MFVSCNGKILKFEYRLLIYRGFSSLMKILQTTIVGIELIKSILTLCNYRQNNYNNKYTLT